MAKWFPNARMTALATIVVVALAGCTSALGNGQTTHAGFNGSVKGLHVVTDRGAEVSQVAEVYAETSGQSVQVTDLSTAQFVEFLDSPGGTEDNLVVWGLWGGEPPAGWSRTEYGRDYSCVIADNAWFAVNRQPIPATNSDLLDPNWAPLFTLVSPAESPATLKWLAGAGRENSAEIESFLSALKTAGVTLVPASQTAATGSESIQSEREGSLQSAELSHSRLRVASALDPWLMANNMGSSSRWVTLPQTCVETTESLWSVGSAAEDFVEFVLSPSGQETVANAGLAYPVSDDTQVPEAVAHLAPKPTVAATIEPAKALELTSAVLRAWTAQVG